MGMRSFTFALDRILKEKADFALIAGDLFNTAVPAIDVLNFTVKQLQRLKHHDIPVYIICGSHDYSPSGKTMIDVLESAGLVINVVKGEVKGNKLHLCFTEDKKTGAKITGMIGRRGMLEKSYYEALEKSHLEKEEGFKIFMLHTALTEFKPKEMADMESSPLSLLPKHFSYYAAGHVHYVFEKDESGQGYGTIVYPGPIFPNTFREIEELKNGSFRLVKFDGKHITAEHIPIEIHPVLSETINCTNLTPSQAELEVEKILDGDIKGRIITLRMEGTLLQGRPSDINFQALMEKFAEKQPYLVLRNTTRLEAKSLDEVRVTADSTEKVEEQLLDEHIGQLTPQDWTKEQEKQFTQQLMHLLSQEKKEGERKYDFDDRLLKETNALLKQS